MGSPNDKHVRFSEQGRGQPWSGPFSVPLTQNARLIGEMRVKASRISSNTATNEPVVSRRHTREDRDHPGKAVLLSCFVGRSEYRTFWFHRSLRPPLAEQHT
jgi:hypothetical protein